jgi:hypothetical protein
MILAPGFLTRKWRKIEIIRLFNESRNAQERGIRYPEHVWQTDALTGLFSILRG